MSIQSEPVKVHRVEIAYSDGSIATISEYEIKNMLNAVEAIELLERAKEIAKRLVNVSSK